MKLRSALMMELRRHLDESSLSQSEAAKLCGVTQPWVSDLVRGEINRFILDTLVDLVAAAGARRTESHQSRVRPRQFIGRLIHPLRSP